MRVTKEAKSTTVKASTTSRGSDGARVPNSPRLLDPHGIYGTRTANRVRVARRRRAWQNAGLLVIAMIAIVAFFAWQRIPRVPWLAATWSQIPTAQTSAAATLARDGDRAVLLVPTESGRMVAMNARDGATQQYVLSDFSLHTAPLVHDQTAWIAGEEGVLSAISWKTGRVLWRRNGLASITTQPASALVANPTAPQKMSVAAGAAPDSMDDKATKSVTNGQTTPPATFTGVKPTRQLVIFYGNDEGIVEAVRAGDGKVLWAREMRAPVGNGLSLTPDLKTDGADDSGAILLVPLLGGVLSRGGVRALDAATGREVWRYPADAKVYAAQLPAPVVFQSGGRAQVICVDDSSAVSCLDARSGHKIWKSYAAPLPVATGNGLVLLRCEPQVLNFKTGQRVFVGGSDGGVRCYDATNGRLLWMFDAGYAVRGPLQIFDAALPSSTAPPDAAVELARSVVAVGTDGPILWLLNASDGQPLARAATGTGLKYGVWIADKQLVVIGQKRVEAFSLAGLPAKS